MADNDDAVPGGRPARTRTVKLIVLTAVISALAAAGLVALLVNIFERKQEARNPFYRVVEITDDTEDPAVWGKNFPLQYDAYLKTVDQVRTKYGGSEALPQTPTEADPRSVVAQSRLEEDPRLKTMWAGYAFAKDFREERGHAYMLDDQTFTERQQVVKQPGTCLNCHALTYVAYKRLGNGDIFKGFEVINQTAYFEARKEITHPVACIDCHDPVTMQLRVTRPAFMEGLRALAASNDPIPHLPSIERWRAQARRVMKSTRWRLARRCARLSAGNAMSSTTSKAPRSALTYPWNNGLKVDNIFSYYEEQKFKDWSHADSGAEALKAQHPEFEMWNQGIHARSGVACADCHMPYIREGAMKISDHHVRSPLLNINSSCQTCHKWPEEELQARVETIQDRTFGLRNLAMDALVDLINDIKSAREAGRSDADLAAARLFQRKAQFYLDFVEAENSTGFHAPQEAARILGESIDASRRGQVALRALNASTR